MATIYSAESASKANAYLAGATIKKAYGTITTTASTAIGDLFVTAQGISPDSIVHSIKVTNTAGTGLSDVDVVVRKAKDLSKPIATEVLVVDSMTLVSARTTMTEVFGTGLVLDKTKTLAQLLGVGNDSICDYLTLAFSANIAGTAATTINYEIEYSSPQ
ncbi:MAG: hypothetical protein WCG95_00070 [bacterium]